VPFAPAASVPRRLSLLLALIAAAGALTVYAQTIGYGFRWDDYHMVHPWTMKELLRVLHSQWDPTKVEVPFYRPVTDWFYALRFELFGWNGAAQHALSVLGIAVCAWMTGRFVLRETGRPITAAFAAAIYALHPAFIYSEGAWLTNQMHLLASLLVIGALLTWQRVRTKPIEAWWPILLLQILAFGVKEDTVMLVPVIVALQIARALVVKDVPYPRWSIVGAGVALTLALPAFRYEMLGKLGGYSVPTYAGMLTNIETALNGIFRMVPPSRPWQREATAFVTWTPVAALALWLWKRDRRAIDLVLTGLIVAGAFVLPFALVTKVEQYHLVALGAVLTLAGAIDILFTTFTGIALRTIVGAYLAAGVATFVPISRNIARDFRPCDPYVLETDGQSMGWWITPQEVRTYLEQKREMCKADRYVPLEQSADTIAWGWAAEPGDDGRPLRWTWDTSVMFVRPSATSMQIALRRPIATAADPVTVTIDGPGGTQAITLTSGDWQFATVPLPRTLLSYLRAMHRVDVTVAPTYVPEDRDPKNMDMRKLGVQFRLTPH
jgi:hypothetical protein